MSNDITSLDLDELNTLINDYENILEKKHTKKRKN